MVHRRRRDMLFHNHYQKVKCREKTGEKKGTDRQIRRINALTISGSVIQPLDMTTKELPLAAPTIELM